MGGVLITINRELPFKFHMHQANNRLPLRIHGTAIDLIDSELQWWMWSLMSELIGEAQLNLFMNVYISQDCLCSEVLIRRPVLIQLDDSP